MWLLSYWLFPVISACMWLGMLLAMFITWEVTGSPDYPSMEQGQTIAYISDVGAYGLKPLFITGSVITTVFLDLAFLSERWLRHTGRLARNTSTGQKWMSIISILFGVAGSAGLILLSIFDTYHHNLIHNGCLLLFIAGYVISAIFLCAGYQRLGIHYRNHRVLRISFWIKLVFILVEVALAIVFGATQYTGHRNIAATFEWVIALVFTFYVLSFVVDLLPSVRTKTHVPQGVKQAELEKATGHHGLHGLHSGDSTRVGSTEYQQPLTDDSTGPNANLHSGYRGVEPTSTSGGIAPQGKKKVGPGHF